MAKIFISYRRSDSAYVAATLSDKLQDRFGPDSVFFDVDNIPLGVDFREYIGNAVGQSDVLLIIIGDQWLDSVDDQGKRRLDEPSDYVRVEIESALKRNIQIIPVLVGKVQMPSADDLPPSIQSIAFRNAAELRAGRDLRQHIDLLIRGLEPIFGSKAPPESITINNRAAAVAHAQASAGNRDRLELLEEIETILDGFADSFLFVGATIPSKRLNNAISSYAAGLSREDVLLLYDNTTLGSAKTGVLLTADSVYWNNGWGYEPEKIRHEEILKVETKHEGSSPLIRLNEKTINIYKAQNDGELAKALANVIRRLSGMEPISDLKPPNESISITDHDAAGVAQMQTSEIRKDRLELLEEIETILDGFTDAFLYVGDTIPSKKLTNAICSYAAKVSREDVLLLYDNTGWGSAKNGVLLTAATVHWCNGWSQLEQIRYEEILNVETNHEASSSQILLNKKKVLIVHAGSHRKLAKALANVIRRLTGMEPILSLKPPPESITISDRDAAGVTQAQASEVGKDRSELLEEIDNILEGFMDTHLFVGDTIPTSRLSNAINSYATNVSPKDVLLLYDNTYFLNAKDGLLLTTDAAYWRNIRDPDQLRYVEILNVEILEGNILRLNEKQFTINHADSQQELAESLANVIRCFSRK